MYRETYLFEQSYQRWSPEGGRLGYGVAGRISMRLVWISAVLVMVLAGIGYRVWGYRLKVLGTEPISLAVPLCELPTRIGSWVGEEMPIGATTREYMEENFADDYVSRRYIDAAANAWVDLYVVYCSTRPGGILGHRPGVCYPAHGWVHENTETSNFVSKAGQKIDCLVSRFRKPVPVVDQVVVLSFYVVNGRITANEDDFAGLWGRRPNVARDPARYVAQVQISSALENFVRLAAGDMTDLILQSLPDQGGKVKAAEYIRFSGGNVRNAD